MGGSDGLSFQEKLEKIIFWGLISAFSLLAFGFLFVYLFASDTSYRRDYLFEFEIRTQNGQAIRKARINVDPVLRENGNIYRYIYRYGAEIQELDLELIRK